MFISGPNGSFERLDIMAEVRRNGSMIDFHFEAFGEHRWFAVHEGDLRVLLATSDGLPGRALITMDFPLVTDA